MNQTNLNNEQAMKQMFISDTLKISLCEWENAHNSKDDKKRKKARISIKIKCAERAYFDYNRTLKFKENADNSDFREGLYRATVKEVNKLISVDIKEASSFDFEGWHNSACYSIMNDTAKNKSVFEENSSFSYGQAQKQLNMTIKYMWMLGLWPVLNSEAITKKLHAVVDNYIIKAAWENYKDIELPLSDSRKKMRENNFDSTDHADRRYYAYSSDKLTDKEGKSYPWSKWNEETYKNFQTSLRTCIKSECIYSCVFEWELDAWNRVATEDKNAPYNDLIEELMTE